MKNRIEIIKEALKSDDKRCIIWTSHPEALEIGKVLTDEQAEWYRKNGVLSFMIRIGTGGVPVLLDEFKIKYFYYDTEEQPAE